MTYAQGYKAALEAAAKVLENSLTAMRYSHVDFGVHYIPLQKAYTIATAIRAIPVPELGDMDMVLVPRNPTWAMESAGDIYKAIGGT